MSRMYLSISLVFLIFCAVYSYVAAQDEEPAPVERKAVADNVERTAVADNVERTAVADDAGPLELDVPEERSTTVKKALLVLPKCLPRKVYVRYLPLPSWLAQLHCKCKPLSVTYSVKWCYGYCGLSGQYPTGNFGAPGDMRNFCRCCRAVSRSVRTYYFKCTNYNGICPFTHNIPINFWSANTCGCRNC